jgi:hypothetical protein
MPAQRLGLAALIVVSMAATSSAAMAAGPVPQLACASVVAHIDPTQAWIGQQVSINWEVSNCSNHTETVRFRWHLFGPCLEDGDQFRATLDPGEAYGLLGIFTPICAGTFKLRGKAFKKSEVLDRAGAKVTVS